MAWVATADFNGLTDGDLNGQGGGTGWTGNWATAGGFSVEGTTVYEGAKAVLMGDNNAGTRTLTTDVNSGIVYFAIRMAQNNGSGMRIVLRNASDQGRINIQVDSIDGFGSTGNIYLFRSNPGGTGVTTLVSSYSTNTWYAIRLTFNCTAGTFSAATNTSGYQSGGSWSSESSSVNMFNSGDIHYFQLSREAASASYYVDYISPTDPLPSVSAIKTVEGLAKASVKTVDGLAIASVKTIQGLA